ncbi:hypothetical protein ACXPWS_10240 [Mycobacterium sp. BMJ-28]
MAAELQRSPSTVSREIRRNTISTRGYLPHTAHRLSVARRARPREVKLGCVSLFASDLVNHLRWNPGNRSRFRQHEEYIVAVAVALTEHVSLPSPEAWRHSPTAQAERRPEGPNVYGLSPNGR